MKKKQLIVAIIFAFIKHGVLFAQTSTSGKDKNANSGACLEIVGIALEKTIPLDDVSVTLYKENEELQWEEITCVPYHEHSFSFDLSCDAHYSIKMSKAGYFDRLVSVFTELPEQAKGKKYLFEFEVEFLKRTDSTDSFYSDFPVAIISYNAKTKVFENHQKYTKRIKGELSNEIFRQSKSKAKKSKQATLNK